MIKSATTRQARIGLTDEQAVAYLPHLLPAFTQAYPEIALEIVCDESPQLVEQVHDGLLDLAMTIHYPGSNGGIVIGYENLYWIAANDFSFFSDGLIPLAVNPDGCIYRANAIAALNGAGLHWRIAFTSATPASTNIAVQTGLGISVKTARALPDGCRLLRSEDGLPSLGRVTVEMHMLTPAPPGPVRMVRDLLIEAARKGKGFVAAI